MGAPEQSVLHMISATDVAGKMHGHLFCIKKKNGTGSSRRLYHISSFGKEKQQIVGVFLNFLKHITQSAGILPLIIYLEMDFLMKIRLATVNTHFKLFHYCLTIVLKSHRLGKCF